MAQLKSRHLTKEKCPCRVGISWGFWGRGPGRIVGEAGLLGNLPLRPRLLVVCTTMGDPMITG